VGHLIGNRASFLCTKAPMLRIPETNFLQGITSISGRHVSGDLRPPSPPAEQSTDQISMDLTEFPRPECIFGQRPQPPLGACSAPNICSLRPMAAHTHGPMPTSSAFKAVARPSGGDARGVAGAVHADAL
jgi:hypothetical protein